MNTTNLQIIHQLWQPTNQLRPTVQIFAQLMEQVLRGNDHKSGWQECELLWLSTKLSEEHGELARNLVAMHDPSGRLSRDYEEGAQGVNVQVTLASIRECIDIANIAMMLADKLSNQLQAVGNGECLASE